MAPVRATPEQILYCQLAVRDGLLSPADIPAVMECLAADPETPASAVVVRCGRMSQADADRIAERVAAALRDTRGDALAALSTAGGDQVAAATFGAQPTLDPEGGPALDRSAAAATLLPHGADEQLHDPDRQSQVSADQHGRYSLLDKNALYDRREHRAASDPTTAELARGGMGRVLVAFDTHLGREVALKELLPPRLPGSSSPPGSDRSPRSPVSATSQQVARFLREARVTGQLEHPAIVPVYELAKRTDGTLYYTMRLVRGRTLRKAIRDCAGLRDRLRLLSHVTDLCHAMAYAHSRGVINRDIKPDNVMVGEFGETVVLDWGLAKVLGREDLRGREIVREIEHVQEAGSDRTIAEFLGTPNYMPPEQAFGRLDEVDERSDIWSTGVVLYEVLTGRTPFTGRTAIEVVTKVRSDPVPPVASLQPDAPVELAAIAMRCLQKDPAKRYQSARELARDLESYQAGERVAAYEYSSWELVRRFVARNRALSVVVAGAVIVLLVAVAVVLRNYEAALDSEAAARAAEGRAVDSEAAALASAGEARRSEQQAVDSRDQALFSEAESRGAEDAARKSEEQARFGLASAFQEKARAALQENRTDMGSAYLALALANRETPDARGELLAATQATPPTHRWSAGPPLSPAMAVPSPDGRFLLVGDTSAAARIFDLSTGLLDVAVAWKDRPTPLVAYAPSGLALLSGDGTLIYDTARNTAVGTIDTFGAGGGGTAIAVSHDGQLVAMPTRAGADVLVQGLQNKRATRYLQGHRNGVAAIAFLAGDKQVLTLDGDGAARAFTLDAQPLGAQPIPGLNGAACLAVTASGRYAVAADRAAGARVFDLAGQRLVMVGAMTEPVARCVAVSSDESLAAVAGDTGTIELLSLPALGKVGLLKGHGGAVSFLAFIPGTKRLVSTGSDRTVRIWDAASRAELARVGESVQTRVLSFPESAAADRRLPLEEANLPQSALPRRVAAMAPDASRMAAAEGREIRVFEGVSGATVARIAWPGGRVTALALANDGRVAVGGDTGMVATLDISRQTDARWAYWIDAGPSPVVHLAYSADGSGMVVAHEDGRMRLCERDGPGCRKVFDAADQAGVVAWSFPNRMRALARPDGKISLEAADRASSSVLLDAGRETVALAFSPGGDALAAVGVDGSVQVWQQPEWRLREIRADAPGRGLFSLAFLGSDTVAQGGLLAGGLAFSSLAAGQTATVVSGDIPPVLALAAGSTDEALFCVHSDGSATAWNTRGVTAVGPAGSREFPFHSLDAAEDGSLLLSGGPTGKLRFAAFPGVERIVESGHTSWVAAVRLSPDGKSYASAGFDGQVRVGDVEGRRVPASFRGPGPWATALAWTGDSATLLVGWSNGHVQWLDPAAGTQGRTVLAAVGVVTDLLVSHDGSRVYVAGFDDSAVRAIDAASGAEAAVLRNRDRGILDIALSPSGRVLAAGSRDGAVSVWDPVSGSLNATLDCECGQATAVTFAAGGRLLLSGGASGGVRGWSLEDLGVWVDLSPAELTGLPVTALASARSGSVVWVGHSDGGLQRLDMASAFEPGRSLAKRWLADAHFRLDGVSLERDYRFRDGDFRWVAGMAPPTGWGIRIQRP